ncbi:MAG: hypothetical protein R2784_16630 [Saprospiraceae bacterium]
MDEINDVYRPFDFQETKPGSSKREMHFVDAVSDGLKEAMKSMHNLF